jgi:hypothetical protein
MITRIARRAGLVLVLAGTAWSGTAPAFSFCSSFGSHRHHDYPGAYLPPPLFQSYPWQPGWAGLPFMPGMTTELQPQPQPDPQPQPAAVQQPRAPVISFPERY